MAGRAETKTAHPPKLIGATRVWPSLESDGGAKQFRFTETDVEGRLKAPQLVYFLRRVRAEFAAGDLGIVRSCANSPRPNAIPTFDGTTDRAIDHHPSSRRGLGDHRAVGENLLGGRVLLLR